MMFMKKLIKYTFIILIIGLVLVVGIDLYVKLSTKDSIKNELEINNTFDCILILGAGVREGKPSPLLKERLDTGISLYKNKKAPKIIMSGDHGKTNYDEVNVMREYAISKGVLEEDIFMDHAGFSTYDSIYRANYIFEAKNILLVSQRYHLYRALYISRKLNIKSLGVDAKKSKMVGDDIRSLREILARNKDFFKVIVKPMPIFLGEKIPLNQDGRITNDKTSTLN